MDSETLKYFDSTTLQGPSNHSGERQVQCAQHDDKPGLDSDNNYNAQSSGETHSLEKTRSVVSIAETLSLTQEILFVSLVCMAQLMTQASLGQTLVIVHVIGDSFGITNPGVLSWLIAGYSLTVGTFILIAGRLGDIFGYKRMLTIGFSWFALWSMIAGLSVYSDGVLFIFSRVFMGFGPALAFPNALAALGTAYAPGPRKGMVFALFGGCAPGGALLGAVFAAIFAQFAWWPWTFWSFAIALGSIAVLSTFIVPDPPTVAARNMSWLAIFKELDPLGGAVGVTSLILINFAWNQSGVVGWQEPYVFVCLILGFLLIPAFFYIELNLTASPLVPFKILSSDVAFVLGCIACGWGSFGIWVYYTWTFVEIFRGATPLLTAAYFTPIAISGLCASLVTGVILHRIGPPWVMVFSLTAFTTGLVLMATAPVDQTYWAQLFVCVLVTPWGMDMSFPSATLIISDAVDRKHQGIGASLVTTVVNYSISLALGFAGTVESHVNNGGKTKADVLKGYRGAFYFGSGLAGLGFALSLVFLVHSYARDRRKHRE